MRLLITGGCGFIGSALVSSALNQGHSVLNIDKLTYAANIKIASKFLAQPSYNLLEADISDQRTVEQAVSAFAPEAILHLAAETHVDRSIDGPAAFVETNVMGTCALLEVARRYWSQLPDERQKDFRFLHVSTDEVFGTLGDSDGAFNLQSKYDPRSPYAASKAASDHFARAWQTTYGLPIIVTNCSNNYGPGQHPEKFIPTIICNAIAGKAIPLYGNGLNRRDWLFVDDHVKGLLQVVYGGVAGQTYLFGGGASLSNIDLAYAVCGILDQKFQHNQSRSYIEQIEFVRDRPGHDFRYEIDATETFSQLGWRTTTSLNEGLAATVNWYLQPDNYAYPEHSFARLGISI